MWKWGWIVCCSAVDPVSSTKLSHIPSHIPYSLSYTHIPTLVPFLYLLSHNVPYTLSLFLSNHLPFFPFKQRYVVTTWWILNVSPIVFCSARNIGKRQRWSALFWNCSIGSAPFQIVWMLYVEGGRWRQPLNVGTHSLHSTVPAVVDTFTQYTLLPHPLKNYHHTLSKNYHHTL